MAWAYQDPRAVAIARGGQTRSRLQTRTRLGSSYARMMRSGLLSLLLALLAACGGSRATLEGPVAPPRRDPRIVVVVPGAPGDEPQSGVPDAVARIDDETAWRVLAARPDNATFARTEVVKVLIDLEDARALYFVNTRRFEIHYYFARDRLSTPGREVESHAAFNVREYRRDDRRFVLGSIVHYLDPDLWTFEMISGDNLPGERVLRAFEQVRGAVYFGDDLRYRPLSDLHEQQTASVRDRMPSIDTDAVFGSTRYQPLTTGATYGYLRTVRGHLDPATVRPDQILVTEEVPNDLPLCAGLVTSTLQAPLAHVAVLSANRGTPNMGLRGAVDDPRLSALDGQLVRLSVGGQDFIVTRASTADAEAHWRSLRPAAAFAPQADTSEEDLVELCDAEASDVDTVGAKAAQLGEVCSLSPAVETPGGFVIPFYHYANHLRQNRLERGIAGMLADDAFRAERMVRAERLSQMRTVIERARVAPALVREVQDHIRDLPRGRLIFRSSTNAEDLVGFNGAGLYRSVVTGPNPGAREIGEAIRQVWASVWSLRGFEERDWYRIQHVNVAMAILVQPFVDNVIANGVAITQNPFNEQRPGVFINVQARGGSVTDPGDEVPEQHLVYTYNEELEPEVLSRSTLTDGRRILEAEDVRRLTAVLQGLHARLVPHYGERSNAVDVEFLVTRDRRIIVLQARPFDVVWDETR